MPLNGLKNLPTEVAFGHSHNVSTVEALSNLALVKLLQYGASLSKKVKLPWSEVERIPYPKLASNFFNGKQFNMDINPDEVFADGAAVQAKLANYLASQRT
ncbi:hypothetical protein BDN72DRAFT_898190 [Pluteus cervinus]|uniref:Uncharacterized protein n=1 Tax=Pluteus cervinus TaxID=181527 RepID=A0ACD3ARH9_9AGAR|nr:hypothetical protein BDN72DRAFT_898190 [Pluteus cervinus]